MVRTTRIALALALAVAAGPAAAAETVPDSEILQMAKAACDGKDFASLFGHFAQTKAVRLAYTAPEVQIRSIDHPDRILQTVPGRDYRDFKIAMVDYSYVDADSADRFFAHKSETLEDLKVDMTETADGAYRVAYVKVEYGPPSGDDGDEQGAIIRTYGHPGAYLFEPRGGCWQLTQDLR
jgi:hypothetical protein